MFGVRCSLLFVGCVLFVVRDCLLLLGVASLLMAVCCCLLFDGCRVFGCLLIVDVFIVVDCCLLMRCCLSVVVCCGLLVLGYCCVFWCLLTFGVCRVLRSVCWSMCVVRCVRWLVVRCVLLFV